MGHSNKYLFILWIILIPLQVMTLVEEYGGDVMKFAGDSMICAFFVDAEERQHPDGGLRACTLRATQCADRLVGDLGSMRMLPDGEVVPEENGYEGLPNLDFPISTS